MDFVVIMPVAYADQCGYQVKNPEGDLVEDNVLGQLPERPERWSADSNVRHDESGDGRALRLHPNPTPRRSNCRDSAVKNRGKCSWLAWMATHFGESGFGEPVSVEVCLQIVPRDCAIWRGRSTGFSPDEGVTQFRRLTLAL